MKNKILELLKENDDLLSRVFWKKDFYQGVEGLNNPKHPIGKKFSKHKIQWFLETEEKAFQFLGVLPEGEVIYLNDNMEISALADEVFIVPFVFLLYNCEDEISVANIRRIYIDNGLSNYVKDMITYTQWCRDNDFNIGDYAILLEIEQNLKQSI